VGASWVAKGATFSEPAYLRLLRAWAVDENPAIRNDPAIPTQRPRNYGLMCLKDALRFPLIYRRLLLDYIA